VDGLKTRQFSRVLYSGSRAARLWRGSRLTGWAASCAATLALACGGCSVSQLDSIYGAADKSDRTGSIAAAAAARPAGDKPVSDLPPEADLAFTKAAIRQVLEKRGNDASEPWENPRTGARGTVTPIAAAYTQSGQTCRDFLASYVNGSSQAWLQGEACKQKHEKGAWEVRSLKPWKRS
jgi:surface antigen